jgi:uncharacterized protein YjbI with pentapeptide repeats
MSCCMAEKYNWCKQEETVFRDQEGREFCVFHAPKGHKQCSVKDFNNKVFNRIDKTIPNGRCILSGTVFEWEIDFSRYDEKKPLPSIDFGNSLFCQTVNFNIAKFSGITFFNDSRFEKNAFFIDAAFSVKAFFSRAMFSGEATFLCSKFSELVTFDYTTFSKEADFREAEFSGKTLFGNAEFIEKAVFSRSKFKADIFFTNCTFSKEADFCEADFSGKTHFVDSTFSEQANFFEAEFSGKIFFINSFCEKLAIFSGINVLDGAIISFRRDQDRGEMFKSGAHFDNSELKGSISFLEIDLSKVLFHATNMKNIQFRRCRFAQKRGRNILFDEARIEKVNPSDFPEVKVLYQQLKEKYKSEGNQDEASNWHYGEKEMFRKENWYRRYIGVSALYWASSGYGERPVRAFMTLLVLFATFTLLTNLFGLVKAPCLDASLDNHVSEIKGFTGTFDLEKFKLLCLNTMEHAFFLTNTFFIPETPGGKFVLILFTKLLIPIQAALYAFALRNIFRR